MAKVLNNFLTYLKFIPQTLFEILRLVGTKYTVPNTIQFLLSSWLDR